MDLVAHQTCPLLSRSLRKFMSTESVMLSNHFVLCHPLLLPSVLPSIRVLTSESALGIRWPEFWNFSLSINPFNEYLGLTSWTEESLVGYSPRDRKESETTERLSLTPLGWASLVDQMVKNLPAMWQTQVRSLGWEDPLEKEMGTHSCILAQRIPWTIVHGVTKSRTRLSDFPLSNYPSPFLTWWWEMPLLETKVSGSPHLRTAFGSARDPSQPSADSWSSLQLCFVWCYLLVSVYVCVCALMIWWYLGLPITHFVFPGIFSFFFWPCHMACGILVPQPGIDPRSWQWKHLVLPTGPSENSLPDNF